ncbi:MAG: AAA family ATPase, partial [Dermatophilaceae bacterium]
MLIGRNAERQVLDSLAAGARRGTSGVLIITGEAGIGKTALLEHAATLLDGMRVDRVLGTALEQDLGYGGLSQLVGASTDEVRGLPEPQARALSVALELESGPTPDRFAVGAATLGLLTRRAEERPVAVLIDDAHLLDHLSAAALAFMARRLVADPILLIATVRSGEPSALLQVGLPVLELTGLDVPTATELLATTAKRMATASTTTSTTASRNATPPDVPTLVAATGGNPLALLELRAAPRRLDRTGHEPPPHVTEAVTRAFQARTERLSTSARTALLVAAAGGADRRLVARACRLLGVDPMHLVEAADVGLVTTEAGTIAFRHPLVRAAVYGAA